MDLWTLSAANPRRKKTKHNPRRSAAQKAATARMLAANRSGGAVSTRRRSPRRQKSGGASMSRPARMSVRGVGNSALALLKTGAVGAGGALIVDVAAGFVMPMLGASFASKQNADGSANYPYYAAKGALAVALGMLGAKIVKGSTAAELAVGSMTVLSYDLLRPFVAGIMPASMPLGWVSPARILTTPRPGMGVGRYMTNGTMGAYNNVTPIANPTNPGLRAPGVGAGAAAAMMNRMGRG